MGAYPCAGQIEAVANNTSTDSKPANPLTGLVTNLRPWCMTAEVPNIRRSPQAAFTATLRIDATTNGSARSRVDGDFAQRGWACAQNVPTTRRGNGAFNLYRLGGFFRLTELFLFSRICWLSEPMPKMARSNESPLHRHKLPKSARAKQKQPRLCHRGCLLKRSSGRT